MAKTSHYQIRINGSDIDMPLLEHMGVHRYTHAVQLGDHAHCGFELVFVSDGSIAYESEDGSVITVQGGQYSFMPPNIRHHPVGGFERPCLASWFIFKPEIEHATKNTAFTEKDFNDLSQQLIGRSTTVQPFRTNTRHALLRFRMACKDFFSPTASPAVPALLRSLATEIIIDGVNHLLSDKAPSDTIYGEAAMAYIKANLFNPISVPDIAAHLGFSESRTYALFRDYSGQTPVNYILSLRIKAAEELLLTSSLTVSDIALQCGFGSSQYFSYNFKKINGITPTQFRAQKKTDQRSH